MPNIPPWAVWIVAGVLGITAIVVVLTDAVPRFGDLVFAIESQWIRFCGGPPPIRVRAVDTSNRLNVAAAGPLGGPDGPYGKDVLINFPPQSVQPNKAEWTIPAPQAGRYRLDVQYAAENDKRRVEILVNDEKWCDDRLSKPTGCWAEKCQDWKEQGVLPLREGNNTIRIESAQNNIIPHIKELRLRWTRDAVVCFNAD